MIAETPCPCCGQNIGRDSELRWNEGTRILIGGGKSVQLRPFQGKMFSKLWKAWPTGRMVSVDEMMAHVYADDPNGGPDSDNTISVQLNDLRKRIAPLGITITRRHGYLICRLAERVAA